MTGAPHIPVLLDEVIEALDPKPGDVVIDATFGAGGYTRALLDRGATVHAFDRDPDAVASGRTWRETEENPPRLRSSSAPLFRDARRHDVGRHRCRGRRGDGYRRVLDAARSGASRVRLLG